MKKLLLAGMFSLAMIMGSFSASAQKFGYINPSELISVMPETKKADETLQKYQDSLNLVYNEMIKELNEKDSVFVADSSKWTPTKRDIKREELKDLFTKVQGYNNTAQQFLEQKQQELLAPISQKAREAIEAVAKQNGYTYVFLKDALIVSPPADDILPLVKKYLKIPETAAK